MTPWQNSELTQTLDNSYAFKGKIYLYRLGNIKKIYIDGFKDIPVGQTTVIDTIPKDYLPIMSDYSWDKNNVSGQPYRIGLLRNGSLSIHVYTSSFSGENNTIFDEVYFWLCFLLTHANSEFQSGRNSIERTIGGITSKEIIFPKAFSSVPAVTVAAETGSVESGIMTIRDVSSTGFTAYTHSKDTNSPMGFCWIAVALKS